MSPVAAFLALLLLEGTVERSGPPVKQAVRKGDLGRWRFEDFRETYYASADLHRRRHPVDIAAYIAEGHRFGVMQGQTAFLRREKPLWLVHNFYCTQPTMTAEVPWDCAAIVFVLQGIDPPLPDARQENGFTLVGAVEEVRIEGDFHAIEPHPELPIFAAVRYGCCDAPALVSVHHFDGRTLCEARELSLWYLGWRGEPWEKIKADAKAVSCLDGSRVPLASPTLQPFAAFDDFRFTEEHQYGHGIELWRSGDRLIGFLLVSNGLQGDTPAGALEDVVHDPATGRLSFGARLSQGTHGCRVHRDVPSREIYRFEGVLTADGVQGLLTLADGWHPGRPPQVERIALRRGEPPPGYRTLAEWQQDANSILRRRGPRW